MQSREAFEFRGTKRFEVRRRIGAGGMGIVYEAWDRDRDQPVALKTLRHLDAQALYRLKNEFRALQDIRHPNLVSLGELIENSGNWFFTMELVHGVDFLRYVTGHATESEEDARATAPQGPLARERIQEAATGRVDHFTPVPKPQPQAHKPRYNEHKLRRGLIGLAHGVHALHEAGKVHRDIKPTNIMVSREGRVVLLDFGLVTEHKAFAVSSESQVVGTAAYMAPEQAAARRTGPAADWHSVGVILYEALTARLPFTGSSIEILMDKQKHDPPPPRTHVPDVPPDLDSLCVELLRFDPDARPSGREVLKRLGADEAVEATSTSTSHGSGAQPFVGRGGEIELMRNAWKHVRAGSPVTVYLHGESGVGKSGLINQFTRQLEARFPGVVILAGRCYERESMHYKAFDGVIDALSRHMRRLPESEASALLPRNAGLLPRVFPILGRVDAIANSPLPRQAVKDPRELRTRVFAALRELLLRMADRHPLVLTIDDLQWADADSSLLLSELLRQPDAPPLLLLISSRARREQDPPIPGDVRRISLQPLDPDSARQLARSLLRRAGLAKKFSAAQIAVDARGNPLFIDQLVRHAAIADRADEESHLQLDQVIWERVSQIPAPASFVLQLVCIAGRPLYQSTIGRAARMDPAEFARHVALLRVANLVRGRRDGELETLEPYHDRVREAVLLNLDEDNRRKRHARLAKALDEAGATRLHPQLVMRHFEAAGELERATECAVEAGDRASAALAFDRAAEFYRTAAGLAQESQRLPIQLKLGESLTHAGRGAEAADIFLEAAHNASSRDRVECQRQAAEQLLTTGFYERGLEVLSKLLAEVDAELPPTPATALRSLLWHRVKLRLRGLRWTEKLPEQIPDRALLELDVYKTASHGLAMVDTVRSADFQARGLLLALKTGERERVGLFLALEAVHVSSQGPRASARARKLLDESRRIAQASASHYLKTWTVLARSFIRYFEDRFASAAEMLGEVERKITNEAKGMRWELTSTRMCRMWSLRHVGAFNEMREACRDYLIDADQRGDRYAATGMRLTGSITLLADDNPTKAREELGRATWTPPADGMHLQHWLQIEARADLGMYEGQATATLEDLDEACERLEGSLLRRLHSLRTNYAWCRGRLLVAAATQTGDADYLARAARYSRDLLKQRSPCAEVMGMLIRAAVAYQRGNEERASADLRRIADHRESEDLLLYTTLAQRWEGALLGGSSGRRLIERANQLLSERGVADPERFAATLAPGFSD